MQSETSRRRLIALNVASTLLGGVWARRPMLQRLETLLGTAGSKARERLVDTILARIGDAPTPSKAGLVRILLHIGELEPATRALMKRRRPVQMVLRSPHAAPPVAAAVAGLPRLTTEGDVAAWLGLPVEHLDWFARAPTRREQPVNQKLQHYSCTFRARAHGPPRLIEAPKARLKRMQRRILDEILGRLPVHEAAHGFVAGRSCLTGASGHERAEVVVGLDLADFFLTTPIGRVYGLFRSLGYPHGAGRVLTGLCTTTTPDGVFEGLVGRSRHMRAVLRAYREPHLPQGAPTSPALANLAAWRMDVRLSGLASALGGHYTRYADDMTFSGDLGFAARTRSLLEAVTTVVEDEGYQLNQRKTRVMPASGRQQVTGIVVNEHLNVARTTYDRLKAILYNCRRNGLVAENREGHPDFRAHLEGRVGWVESVNPRRGRKLRALLESIP